MSSCAAVLQHAIDPALRPVRAAGQFFVPPPRLLAASPGADDAVGEPAKLLDEREPQHDRDGPDFADRELRRALIGAGEVDERLEIDAPGGVGDQLAREDVDARISLKGAVGELGQLEVVAARKVLPDLADLILNDVMVVAQPVLGRDRLRVGAGGGREEAVRRIEARSAVVERGQQRAAAPRIARPADALPRCARRAPRVDPG